MRNNKSLICSPQYSLLVANLKNKKLTSLEIIRLLHMPETKESRDAVSRMILTIGTYYPVYEPIPSQFKILTNEDMDEWEKEYRRQKELKEWNEKICRSITK